MVKTGECPALVQSMERQLAEATFIVTVLLMLSAIGFGAAAFGDAFRFYSIISLVMLLTFGILTGLEAPNVESNGSTPLIGVWERINIGVFLLWIVILATVLLGRKELNKFG